MGPWRQGSRQAEPQGAGGWISLLVTSTILLLQLRTPLVPIYLLAPYSLRPCQVLLPPGPLPTPRAILGDVIADVCRAWDHQQNKEL